MSKRNGLLFPLDGPLTSRDSFKLFKPYPEKYYFVRLSTLVIQFTHVQVIIEAVLEGHPKYTELFSESLNEGLVRGNCPGFIVASSEEGLKKQHFSLDSPFNIHTLLIQPDEMKSVDLTENMHFSYSSARDAYCSILYTTMGLRRRKVKHITGNHTQSDMASSGRRITTCGRGLKRFSALAQKSALVEK